MRLFLASNSKLGLILAVAAAPLLHAQFRGPVSGFVYHAPSRSVRPIAGIPGSAYLAAPLLTDVDFGAVSPGGKWALIGRAGEQYALSGLDANQAAEFPVTGLIQDIDRVAWSQDERSAVVYSSAQQLVQKVRFSVSGVTSEPPYAICGAGGRMTALAMDASGRRVAWAIEGSTDSGVFQQTGDAEPAFLLSMNRPAALAFASGTGALVAVDGESGDIRVFADTDVVSVLPAPSKDGVAAGMFVAVSRDGRRIYVAAAGEAVLRIYDQATEKLISSQPLDVAPNCLVPLSDGSTYLLNSAVKAGDPLMVYQDNDRSGVYLIPVNEMALSAQ